MTLPSARRRGCHKRRRTTHVGDARVFFGFVILSFVISCPEPPCDFKSLL